MLDNKRLIYSTFKDGLIVKNGNTVFIISQLNIHNLYYLNINNNIYIIISLFYAKTIAISLLSTNLAIWYYRFRNLNNMYLKRLLNIISRMKILTKVKDLSFNTIYIQGKITKQSNHDLYILSKILGFNIYLNIKTNINIYIT